LEGIFIEFVYQWSINFSFPQKPVDLKESFVADKKKSEVLFYKVLECGSLEVAFADLSPDRKNADQPPEYNVIMKDIPVKIRVSI